MPHRLALSVPLLLVIATVLRSQNAPPKRVEELYASAKAAQQRGDLASATAAYRELIRVAPTLGAAYNNLGALYFRQQQYAEAVQILTEGLKVDAAMLSSSALLGISLYETGQYKQARARLDAVLQANPADRNARLYLAKSLIQLRDFEAASVQLQLLGARNPKDQEIWYLLSKVYMKLSEQALANMNAIDPNSVLAHQLSAEVMESMNNYDGAIVELQKAVALAPSLPGNHYKLGEAFWTQSAWDQAQEQFQGEVAINPAHCAALAKLGNIALQKGDPPAAALELLNRSLVACPSSAVALIDRSRALAKLGRSAEAVADLEQAAKIAPAEANTHFLLAKAYRVIGRADRAREEMEIFTKLDEQARAAVAERAQDVIRNKQSAH